MNLCGGKFIPIGGSFVCSFCTKNAGRISAFLLTVTFKAKTLKTRTVTCMSSLSGKEVWTESFYSQLLGLCFTRYRKYREKTGGIKIYPQESLEHNGSDTGSSRFMQ